MADHQVTVSWNTTPQNFPFGTVGGVFHVVISGAVLPAPLVMDVPASPAVFPAVPAELATDPDYTVTVQRQDANGVALGSPATATFSVVEPPVVVDVPGTVTVAVA